MKPPPPRYDTILAELEARVRFALRPHSRPAEKLAPLRRLLERLGHPERHGRIVHIAGTNGKGTTAEMVARLLRQAGNNAGLYTSPHLLDLRERVRVNGDPAPKELFASVAARVLSEQGTMPQGESLSYFDVLTAIGFTVFREMGTDWTVLETGLGGAADSTNVTESKVLSILTPIGHDHLTVLGGDLRSVARQKMGIARPGTPVVLFRQTNDLHDWMTGELEAAGSRVIPGDQIRIQEMTGRPGFAQVAWPDGQAATFALPWHLATEPHFACSAAALTAIDIVLGEANGEERNARAAVALDTSLPGRLQLAERVGWIGDPAARWERIVLDGAHNREALAALNAALDRWNVRGYTLLITLMRDKLIDPVREPLRGLLAGAERVIGVTLPYDRAPNAEELRDFLKPLLPRQRRSKPIDVAGLDEALRIAAQHPAQPLVAAGSLWMLGDLMKRLIFPADTAPDAQPKAFARAESKSTLSKAEAR